MAGFSPQTGQSRLRSIGVRLVQPLCSGRPSLRDPRQCLQQDGDSFPLSGHKRIDARVRLGQPQLLRHFLLRHPEQLRRRSMRLNQVVCLTRRAPALDCFFPLPEKTLGQLSLLKQ